MTDLGLVTTIALVFMCLSTALLIAYIGANRAAKQRQEEIDRLKGVQRNLIELGNGLYRYVKNDVASGRTAFSFTGQSRPFEVWRNNNLEVGERLAGSWEKRNTFDPGSEINLPSPRPLTPDSMDAVARASMDYQPPNIHDWRGIGTETGRGHSEGLGKDDFQ